MSIIQPRVPSGFPEYLPEYQIEFDRMKDVIREKYEKFGFSPIDTAGVELKDVLLAKGGGETDKQVYMVQNAGEKEAKMCLPFDLTVPLARYTAQHQSDLTFPFRRYHIAKVHRGEHAQKGRFREFYQCDIDVIGTNSVVVDAEIPAVINEIFEEFGFGEFTIRVNNRKILNGFFDYLGLSGRETEVMRLVDKIEKMSRENFVAELENAGLTSAQIEKLIAFTEILGDNDEIITKLANLDIDNEAFREGMSDIKTLISAIRNYGVPEKRFCLDLRIARGLDYYTGTVYETFLNEHREIGSVCSGGRFDNLAENYTDTHLPGVGISIGLSRLFYKLVEIGVIKPGAKSPAKAAVLPMDENQFEYAIRVSAKLRQSSVANILYTEPGKFKKKMSYADAMGFDYAVIVGEDEVADGTITLKDMHSGESRIVKFDEIGMIDW